MKIGDKVSVIDDDLHGEITSVHADKIVFEDEHGFTHQFSKEKLVVRERDFYENAPIIIKSEFRKTTSKKHATKDFTLDLHFDKLVAQPSQFNAFERLFIQKEKLLETLKFCRTNKIKKLRIIHGIGDGTLQKMVEDTLKSQSNLEFHRTDVLHQQSGAVIVYF